MSKPIDKKIISCQCGKAVLEVRGKHIISVACYCDDCQEAAQKLATLSAANTSGILEDDDGTQFVLYRKDRVTCIKGAETLKEYRLTSNSTTRRVIATCCNTPMFLEFEKGHWLSIYNKRFTLSNQPAVEQRTMTKYKRADVQFTDTIPSPPSHTYSFIWKLMMAWAAMKFKTPKINYVNGTINI